MHWKPFKKEFDETIANFRNHRESVEREAQAAHMIEEAHVRALGFADKKGDFLPTWRIAEANIVTAEKRMRLLAQLFSVDYEYHHRRHQSKRHKNTGQWLVETSEFKDWVSSDKSCSLWCTGIRKSRVVLLPAR